MVPRSHHCIMTTVTHGGNELCSIVNACTIPGRETDGWMEGWTQGRAAAGGVLYVITKSGL